MITRPSFGLCERFPGCVVDEDPVCGIVCNCGSNTKKVIAMAIVTPAPIAAPMIFLFNNIFKNWRY